MEKYTKNILDDKETGTQSRPRMCGTLLLWMGAEKMKRLQQKKSQKSSEEE